MLIEAVVCSRSDAVAAERAGASRVEICVDITTAGLTPPTDLVQAIRSAIKIPIVVMIRPRPGDYIFSEGEKAEMLEDITQFAPLADALIFGALTEAGTLDAEFLRQMVERASGKDCVIHRSIDSVPDFLTAVEAAIEIGFKRILTSGHAPDAYAGRFVLRELQSRYGSQIEILPAGGIRATNILEIIRDSGVNQVHLGPRKENILEIDDEALRQVVSLTRAA